MARPPAFPAAALLALTLAAGAVQAQHKPHVHGVMKLDVAVDGPLLTVLIDSPLDGLVGFEHRPRTDAQRRAAADALATLRDPARWLKPDAAAGCSVAAVEITAAVLEGPAPPAGAKESGHADLEGRVELRCSAPAALRTLEIGLFDAFARTRTIEVQVAGASAQSKQVLRRPARRIALTR